MVKNVWPALVACLLACGPTSPDDDNVMGEIEVAPADLSVTVIDGAAVTQAYTATLVEPDGDRRDVTDRVVFTVADANAGVWSGASLAITGGAAGPTRVRASIGQATGDTGLTIYVKGTRNDGAVPPNADALFDAATETAGRAPAIAYPADKILVPPNLGEFDVHWRDTAGNNLIRVSLKNEYVDLRIFKAATGAAYTIYKREEWYTVASPHAPLTLTVAGLSTSSPGVKGTATQHIDVTNEQMLGGVYYWSTSPTQGIYRYDMSTPDVAPASFFAAGTQPTACIGCHAISRDGSKIAITLEDFDGPGTVLNVADRTPLVAASAAQPWNFATFNADATKLVTAYQGQMVLRAASGGSVLATIPNTAGSKGTHPELTTDGTRLASVETPNNPLEEWDITSASIVTRTFNDATNTFGPSSVLVAATATASSYYPSWSPDGEWLVFTRSNGTSNSNINAEIWTVKADGSRPPIRLALANQGAGLTNSWARWAPFVQSTGSGQRVYYLTFSTTRPFGVRTAGGPQIWMSPFYPDRATAGQDPSGPAFRLPFQLLSTSNHIAQWTQSIVIARTVE